MSKTIRIEVNRKDEDNARIHKQCEQINNLVGDEQVALIVVGEFTELDDGIRCKATTVMHIDKDKKKDKSKLALIGALLDNKTQNEDLCDVIFGAAALYQERMQQQASMN